MATCQTNNQMRYMRRTMPEGVYLYQKRTG